MQAPPKRRKGPSAGLARTSAVPGISLEVMGKSKGRAC